MFSEKIEKRLRVLTNKGDRLAIAVSGGIDSMTLLYLSDFFKDKLDIRLLAVNIEHGIRGEASKNDSAFVKAYCESKGIPLREFAFDIPRIAKNDGLGLEECARNKRYEAFSSLIESRECDKIALAHHAGDQAETIFMRIMRGTGIEGLAGMSNSREGVYIRPFLDSTRREIEEFAAKLKIPYVTDESNSDDSYTRNFIRNNVFPLLKTKFPGLENALTRLAANASAVNAYLLKQIETFNISSQKNGVVKIPEKALEDPALGKLCLDRGLSSLGIFQDIESRHFEELKKLRKAENGSAIDLPFNVTAEKEYGFITLRNRQNHLRDLTEDISVSLSQALKDKEQLHIFGLSLIIEKINGEFHRNRSKGSSQISRTLCADPDKFPSTSVIRFSRDGDIFKKFGGGTKKLCDFFTDKKIERRLRREIPVIADGNKILTVVGVEISDDVRIDQNSSGALKIIREAINE